MAGEQTSSPEMDLRKKKMRRSNVRGFLVAIEELVVVLK